MLKKIRIVVWIAVALAAAGLAYLLLRAPSSEQLGPQPVEMVELGGPFTLTGADGKPFSSTRLQGRPYAIFFGFTHCPDVCPTTLARMVRLRDQLGPSGEKLQILFVTVDPERDGPAEVGKYAELFDAPLTGLTGSPAQIEQVKKEFGIFSRKVPSEGGDYSVDHTATVLLFDKNGEFTGTIAQEETDQPALAKLQRIVA